MDEQERARGIGSWTFLLKVSRPGLWFQTIWLYTVPLGAGMAWETPAFWLGLAYVTWPLNLLVYGWNDIVDYEIDRDNPRKDSWLFGARGTRAQLDALPPYIALAQLPFALAFAWLAGAWPLLVVAAMVAANGAYNAPIRGLRGRPPMDLINPVAYVLVTLLSVLLNDAPALPAWSYAYLALFTVHAQLVGEVMDYHADLASGRVTSCTRIGILPSKWIVIALVLIEAAIVWRVFADTPLAAMLLVGSAWLVWDALVYSRTRRYSSAEFRVAGVAMNLVGLASMLWVWHAGSIARLPAG